VPFSHQKSSTTVVLNFLRWVNYSDCVNAHLKLTFKSTSNYKLYRLKFFTEFLKMQ